MTGLVTPRRWRGLLLVYAGAALLSFPVLEMLVSGRHARDFAHDVFDDGAVTRLGAMRFDLSTFGPVLWNAHLMAGNTYVGQFNATPIALDSFLALLAPPFVAYAATVVLMAFLSGLSMHLFLEESVGLPRGAAFAGGLIYILGFRHYAFGFSAVLLPLLLWLSDRAEAPGAGRWRRLVAPSLCAAFLLYDFAPQPAVLAGALHLGYAFVGGQTAAERRSRLAAWAGSWVLAFALYAPVLFAQLRLLSESERTVREGATGLPGPFLAVGQWLGTYAEVIASRPGAIAVGLPLREAADGTWYVGFAALGVLVLSLGVRRETRRQGALAWLLVGLPLFDLVSMLLVPEQKHLGVLQSFAFNRIRTFLPFALAANAAVAAALLFSPGAAPIRLRWRPRFAGPALLGLFLACGALCGRLLLYLWRRQAEGSPANPERIAGWATALAYFAVAALATSLVLLYLRRGGPAEGPGSVPRRAVVLLLGLLALERLVYTRIERLVENQTLGSFAGGLDATPAVRYLQAQPNPDGRRVLTLADRSRLNPRDHPNRMMFHGLYTADGYQNVYPLRYHQFFGLLTRPHLDRNRFHRRYFHEWGQRAYLFGPEFNPALASLMGVRWLYARGVAFSEPGWNLVFEEGDERVFENANAFPRGFLAARAETFPTRAALMEALSSASPEALRSAVYLEGGAPAALAAGPAELPGSEVALELNTPDRIRFRVRSSAPAVLVLTDAYTPGWKSAVNGAPRDILPAYNAFRAVEVPAGDSEVVFWYAPTFIYAGAAVAAAAMLLLAALGLPAFRRKARGIVRSHP